MNYQKYRYFCIIAAAGVGQRIGSNQPKQYLPIANRTLIEMSIEPFLISQHIENVVVVLSKYDQWFSELSIAQHPKISVVEGGAERCESVIRGLESLSTTANPQDWILVHDAARPNFKIEDLNKLIETVADHPVGGILGCPVSDSLKHVNHENAIQKNSSREGIWRAFTPQMFRYELLLSSLKHCIDNNQMVTDEASALTYFDHQPLMISGRSDNFKVTTVEDYEMMKKILIASELEIL